MSADALEEKLISWLIQWSSYNTFIAFADGVKRPKEPVSVTLGVTLRYVRRREIWLLNLGGKAGNNRQITSSEKKNLFAKYSTLDEDMKNILSSHLDFDIEKPEETDGCIDWAFEASEGGGIYDDDGNLRDSVGGGYLGNIRYDKAKGQFSIAPHVLPTYIV